VNSRVLKTLKLKCRNPEIPTFVGDSCDVGPGGERLEVQEPGVGEGSKCENPQGPKPRNSKPQSPKVPNFSKTKEPSRI
jgi:hypothetical protein